MPEPEKKDRRGAPAGNSRSLKHGFYGKKILPEPDHPLFDKIVAKLYHDFQFNSSSDFLQIELLAVYYLKMGQVQESGNMDAAERLDRMIRNHMKDLKATRISRDGEVTDGNRGVAPADIVSFLLIEHKKKKAASQKKADGQPGTKKKTQK